MAHDIYIMFINFKNNVEKVYVANSPQLGDGVDVIAGEIRQQLNLWSGLKNNNTVCKPTQHEICIYHVDSQFPALTLVLNNMQYKISIILYSISGVLV